MDEGHFVKGLAQNPRDAWLRVSYGRWLLDAQRPAEAEVEARSAVAASPSDPALRAELAQLLADAGDSLGAETEFSVALAACGGCAAQRAALASFLEFTDSNRAEVEFTVVVADPDAGVAVLIEAARFFERRGSLRAAERAYVQAVELDPSALSMTRYAGFLRHHRRAYREAEAMYSAALREDPSFRDAIIGYATFLEVVRGDVSGAVELFERASRDPSDSNSREAYAKLLLRGRQFLRMREVAREAVAVDPALAPAWEFMDRWDPAPESVRDCMRSVDVADVLACVLFLGAQSAAALLASSVLR